MKLINPITVNDSVLHSSTISEPDLTRGETLWTAGSYTVGQEVIKSTTHRKYRCAVNTSDDPEVGVNKTTPTWVDIGATNLYAMFDDKNGSKSVGNLSLIVELEPLQVYTAITGFYITGASSIEVTMTDPTDGVVYNKFIEIQDYSAIVDYYEWFFYPIINITEFVLVDLPTYNNAILKVDITGTGDVSVGSMPFGTQTELGVANHGTSLDLIDLSRKDRDEFGNYTIVERPTFNIIDFDVTLQKSHARHINQIVSQYTTKPIVWVGGEGSESPVFVFGYYKSFRVNIDTPTICSASLQIEELT